MSSLSGFLPVDRELAGFRRDGDLVAGEASDGDVDLELVLAFTNDVVRRVTLVGVPRPVIETVEEGFEADGVTRKRREVEGPHSHILHEAT